MAEIVRMPKLSDTMTEGVLAKWHKKVGDKVKSGELLADIETDKATMEFESFQDGVLIYQGIEEGKGAPVDSIIAILGKGGEDVQQILASVKNQSTGGSQEKATGNAQKADDKPQKTESSGQKTESTQSDSTDRIKASPLAKAL